MKTDQIRKLFLDFFAKKEHTIVPGSSLIPGNDPTLLFTNAGMVQFKDTFLGVEKRSYVRAASCQPCVRAGGKHNDLENVGYTARHHTFFEMLGNFSFGDYFKEDAIRYAWEFITEVLKIPKERLWITVFKDDEESEDIWLNEIKVDPKRFSRCGEKDNFWSMGDTGPCGPCTEIFYDHGETIPGGPPGSKDEDGDRYVEIWNLVFMQYNRSQEGHLSALPAPSVDTGMGLERVSAVMQGVHSNYDIDLFQSLIKSVMQVTGATDSHNKSLRVIADHIRSCAFIIKDGVIPSNEGRGYVLRRVCRRAIRHGVRLGMHDPFFYKLVQPLAKLMGDTYPDLKEAAPKIEKVLQQEEIQFARTLEQGLKILEQDLNAVKDNVVPGDTIFKLYDTYGFPYDLTGDIARERGMTLDMDGFNEAMAKQKSRARESSQFGAAISEHIDIKHVTDFTGYESLEHKAKIAALFSQGQAVLELNQGEEGAVVLESSPFYAEAGGQVGDQGTLFNKNVSFKVENTKKMAQAHLHYGKVEKGQLKIDDEVVAQVDFNKRKATALNHSATHLLHAALRKVLGPHVQQKGSLVEPLRLRFDFTHSEPLTQEQIHAVEEIVNDQIRLNTEVVTDIMPLEQAKKSGAMALFGEKYANDVRVLHMGENDFSVELCGGTHVSRTGDIGLFKITTQSNIASGVRRVEGVTGSEAIRLVENLENTVNQICNTLKTSKDMLKVKILLLLDLNNQLKKELGQAKREVLMSEATASYESEKLKDIQGVKVLSITVSEKDPKTLREKVDHYKSKNKSAVIILAGVDEEKVILVAGVTKDVTNRIQAGELVKFVATKIGGQGGGRPDMAQGGGIYDPKDPFRLTNVMDSVYDWIEEKLGSGSGAGSGSKTVAD